MKKGFLKFLAVIIFLITLLFIPKNVNALTFKVEKSVDTIKPGKEVIVYIKAGDIGDDSIDKYKVTLNYDAGKLELKSAVSDLAEITTNNPIEMTAKTGTLTDGVTLATITFQAKNTTTSSDANLTINSSNCYAISDTENKNEIKATNTSSMVRVEALSNDATLSSLKIPNATISPKFDKNTLEYKTTIQDITEITVNATPSDAGSTIMISDNYKSLQKGDNEIKISVTAEDGQTKKTYIVKVTLKLTPTDEELKKANANLKSLKIDGYDIDFDSAIKKYTLTVPYSTSKINILAEAENDKATVNLEGNTNLKVGRNTIKVIVNSEDQKTKTEYTLTVTREKEVKKVVQTCPDTTSKNEWMIFSICTILTFTMGIILGYFLCKKEILKKIFKRKNKKIEEEVLSDTIEIPNNKIKKELNNINKNKLK